MSFNILTNFKFIAAATQRLDDDLAGYFEKQEAATEAANKAEAGAEEKKE